MRKKVFGRRFKRNKDQRKALFKSLMSSLVLEERIKTTEEKAKSIKGQIEKLVTKVKKRGETAKSLLNEYLSSNALDKFVKDVAPRFSERNGGYTRIIRIGKRHDSSSMVFLEWIETATLGPDNSNKTLEDKLSVSDKFSGLVVGKASGKKKQKNAAAEAENKNETQKQKKIKETKVRKEKKEK